MSEWAREKSRNLEGKDCQIKIESKMPKLSKKQEEKSLKILRLKREFFMFVFKNYVSSSFFNSQERERERERCVKREREGKR
jgi:hypothetical protein